MMKRCRKYSGKVFIAEDEGQAVGFITVLGRMKYTDPDDYPHEYALIEDLIVHVTHRGRGIGRQLLSRAEDFAREIDIASLQLEVTAANFRARNIYNLAGFQEAGLELEKKLG
jgi:ribosomal protein S18 acetylase RimI-like enzyme